MWIKLISPRMSLRPMDTELKRRMSPSLALLTLGALTPAGHRVTLEDENTGTADLTDCPDLVGITVNVDTSSRAYAIADKYRSRGIPVVLGGIHASAVPEEAERHADAVVIGPAEPVWEQVLNDLCEGRLQPRYKGTTDPRQVVTPPPRWDLIAPGHYLYTNLVSASRGCPHRCDFCYNSCAYARRGFRPRPIPEIIADIERLRTHHVMFIDDNLLGDCRWTWELVRAIAPLRLKWNAAVSADIGSHGELLDAMADAGCQSLFIGVESLNAASLSEAHKQQNRIELYDGLVDALHRRGIMINASLVFGFDHDDASVFDTTLDWLITRRIETMTAHILTPYPGTHLHDRLERENRIVDRDSSHYNTAHVVFEPARMGADELLAGYLRMYRQFYSLGSILRRLPVDRRRRVPYLLFNLGYRKLGRFTSLIGRMGAMHRLGRLARRLAYGVD